MNEALKLSKCALRGQFPLTWSQKLGMFKCTLFILAPVKLNVANNDVNHIFKDALLNGN